MNAVEIEEAISALAEELFDQAGFPYAFLKAFGNKKATLYKLEKGDANKSDVERVSMNAPSPSVACWPTVSRVKSRST